MSFNIENTFAELFVEILENSSDAVISFCKDQKVVHFNKSAKNLFGYSDKEFEGLSLNQLIPPNFKKTHSDLVKEFDKSGDISRTMGGRKSVEGLTKGGILVPLDITIQKHLTNNACKYTVICRDISFRVATTKVLEKSTKRLNRAQELTKIGNWEWDIPTGDLHWSKQIFKIFGRDPDTFQHSYDAFLETIHPMDKDRVVQAVNNCVENNQPYKIIHRIICPDGEEKVVQEIGELYQDEKGNPLRMDGTVQDITERWKREQELIKTLERLEEAQRTKNQFLATMSHELRTPLNAIIGFGSIMADNTFGECEIPQHQEYSQAILDSGSHLLRVINNILDLTKIDLGKIELQPSTFQAEDFVQEALYIINHEAVKKGVIIEVDIPENFPEFYLDRTYFLQILVNLLSNAIKFSNNNSKVFIILTQDKTSFSLEVIDHGIGIKKEIADTIWQPFTQAEMDLARKYEGTGLGLSIIKAFTEAQGGQVELKTEFGKGANFKVTLPFSLR